MLNGIFVVIILLSVLLGAISGQMQAVTDAILASARNAVDLAIGLIGVMALFLGLFRVAEDGGLLRAVSRAVAPIPRVLFPGIGCPGGSTRRQAVRREAVSWPEP